MMKTALKRLAVAFMAICILIPSLVLSAKADPIPSRFASIMETCNATTVEEMYQHILDYLNNLHPEMNGHYTTKHYPMKICFGWTTKELITNKRKWDMAIVSSKDVDLQALADKKLIKHWWFIPNSGQVLPQWLLSDELLSLLPSGIMQSYDIYFFDYDVEAADTTIVIMNANSVDASNIPQAMLDMRNANLKRNTEGIARAENWTVERLISNPESWDTATLLLSDATKQFPRKLQVQVGHPHSRNQFMNHGSEESLGCPQERGCRSPRAANS